VCDQTRGPTSILMNMAAEEADPASRRRRVTLRGKAKPRGRHIALERQKSTRGGAWLAKQNRDTAIADKPVTPKNTTF